MKLKIVFLLIISLFIMSCDQIENNIPKNKGELEPDGTSGFSFVFNINSKSFSPNIDYSVRKIVIQLDGPNGEYDYSTFLLSETNSIVIDELNVGTWKIHIDGYNSSDNLFVDWYGEAEILPNENTVIEVVLKPIEGQGTFDIELSWPEGEFKSPILEGELQLSGTVDKTPISFIQENNSFSAKADLPNGNYTLFLRLYEGENNKVWGKVSSVLILANNTTSANLILSLEEGGLVVDIVLNLPKPIDLTLLGTRDILGADESLTVYAIPESNDNCTYSWYVDGVLQESVTENSFFIGAGGVTFEPGHYQIDVIARDGMNEGSAGFSIKIINTANDSNAIVADYTMVDASVLSQTDLDLVRQKKIMMLHASVGGNVIEGLKDLATMNSERYSLNFTRQSNSSYFDELWYEQESGVFGDYYMGDINSFPQAKLDFFDSALKTNNLGNKVDIIIFKFCYLDGYLKNDFETPEELFGATRAKIEELESLFPDAVFVWVTLPVTLLCSNNAFVYGQLVRDYCLTNKKYLLDLSNIESHSLSGEHNVNEGRCELMVPEYTIDSGHLNELGRDRVANALWHLLVDIAKNN